MIRSALLALAVMLAIGCTRAGLAPRYLSRCPAAGPEVAADLGIRPMPLDLADFYAAIRARASAFEIGELGTVRDGAAEHPILVIRHRGAPARPKVLVVAGVHGNETAGLHAVPAILDLLHTGRPELRASDVTVVAPVNPVGVLHGSRYNAEGCDPNRDFRGPRTEEARLLHDFIASEPPDRIVSLHEGPQDGYLLVVTSKGSKRLAEAAVHGVAERGIPLASSHFAGFRLGTPGLSFEGGGTDFAKWALRLHTLGSFANGMGIGTYTTETSWASEDFEARVLAHVVTVEALLIAGADAGDGAAGVGGIEAPVDRGVGAGAELPSRASPGRPVAKRGSVTEHSGSRAPRGGRR